jgi:hypothetical protein
MPHTLIALSSNLAGEYKIYTKEAGIADTCMEEEGSLIYEDMVNARKWLEAHPGKTYRDYSRYQARQSNA